MADEKLIRNVIDTLWPQFTKALCVEGGICLGCEQCVVKNIEGTKAILDAGAERIGSSLGSIPSDRNIAKFIDHTQLKADTTEEDIKELCSEADENGFASVCINPCWVPLCAELLKESEAKVCTVIGFPLGATSTESKVYEVQIAKEQGAVEFDMVANIGLLKSKKYRDVFDDIKAVVDTVAPDVVKVIIETALLTDEEKIEACVLAKEAGAHFVKTSTGFSKAGATVHDVELMKRVVGEDVEVKASGGVKDFETAVEMIKAGATRIGASAGIAIIYGGKGATEY